MAPTTRRKKLILRTGHFEHMTVAFGTDFSSQHQRPVLGLYLEGSNAMARQTSDGPRSFTFNINTNNGDITISETRGSESSTVRKGVCMRHGTYTVLANERRDGNVWHILIESNEPIKVQTETSEQGQAYIAATKSGRTEVVEGIKLKMKRYLLLGKYEEWFSQNEVKYVELIVPDCDRSTVTDIDALESVFDNLNIRQPDVSPADFVAASHTALNIEKRLADEAKAEMSRDRIRCYFFHPPGREQQLHVRLSEAPTTQNLTAWTLGSHETIIFRRKGSLMDRTSEIIREHTVFANIPPPVPRGTEILSRWTGRTYLCDNTLYAQIENDLSFYIEKDLLQDAFNTACDNISIEVINRDARRPRIDRGLQILEEVLKFEQGSSADDLAVPLFVSMYKLNMSSLFLDRVLYQRSSEPRLTLKPGKSWQLTQSGGNPSQRRAILTALTASEGLACIQGPPATGKTTTIAHLLCNAIDLLDPRHGLIVCGAETNEAVYVMAAQFRQVYGEIHGDDAAIARIVVVDTEAKQQYARLSGEPPRHEVKPMLLRSHMKRIARRDPDKYAGWLAGERVLKLKGHITDNKVFKVHTILSRELIAVVKSENPVCFSTLGSMHCRDGFFGGSKGYPTFQCSLFVCDEASQVAPPSYVQSVTTINPTAAILCGDHKQLSPYVRSSELLPMLRRSIFEKHIRKGATSVMLDEEYRTRREIFCGTNVHYGNTIKVAPEVHAQDSIFYTEFMNNIGRISFMQTVLVDGEPTKQHTYLSHNVHFINVKTGTCEKAGETESCINKREAEIIRGIIGCLLICGMPHSSVLALTGYKGQHDRLKQDLAPWGIRIRTIEGFQGGEADFIIFSAVRTPEVGIGFISRPSKQNVATSRAKDAFFIVGNLKMFQGAAKKHPGWMNTINALRNFSPDQEQQFQINVEGEITEWCVDGIPVELGDIAADFVETFDDPMLAIGGDEEEEEDNEDGGVVITEDEEQW